MIYSLKKHASYLASAVTIILLFSVDYFVILNGYSSELFILSVFFLIWMFYDLTTKGYNFGHYSFSNEYYKYIYQKADELLIFFSLIIVGGYISVAIAGLDSRALFGPVVGPFILVLLIVIYLFRVNTDYRSEEYKQEMMNFVSKASILSFLYLGINRISTPSQTPDTIQYVTRGYSYLYTTFGITAPMEWFRSVHTYPVSEMTGTPGIPTQIISMLMTWVLPFQDPITSSRFGSLLVLTIFLILFERLVTDIWSKEIAMWTTLMLAFNTYFLSFTRIVNPDSILPAFTTLALLSFYKGYNGSINHIYLFVVTLSLAILTKITALILGPVFLIWYILKDSGRYTITEYIKLKFIDKNAIVLFFCSFLAVGLAAILWPELYGGARSFQSFYITVFQGAEVYSTSANPNQYLVLSKYVAGWPNVTYLVLILARTPVVVIALIIIGFLYMGEKPVEDHNLLIIISILFPLLFISQSGKMGDKYHLFLYPSLMITGGIGMSVFRTKVPKSVLLGLILVIIIPSLIFTPYYFHGYNSLTNYGEDVDKFYSPGWGDGHKETAKYISKEYGSGEDISVLGYGGIISDNYEGNVNGLPPDTELDNLPNNIIVCYSLHTSIKYGGYTNVCQQLKNERTPTEIITINNVDLMYIYDNRP